MLHDYNKAKVIFKSGAWVEARVVEIDFELREITIRDIGNMAGLSEYDKKIIDVDDIITFSGWAKQIVKIEYCEGSFTPF